MVIGRWRFMDAECILKDAPLNLINSMPLIMQDLADVTDPETTLEMLNGALFLAAVSGKKRLYGLMIRTFWKKTFSDGRTISKSKAGRPCLKFNSVVVL